MIRCRRLRCAMLLGCLLTGASAQSPNWAYVGPAGFSAGDTSSVRLAFDSAGAPCVAYTDLTVAKTRVQKLGPSGWAPIGGDGIASLGTSFYNTIALDSADRVYVASRDYGAAGRMNVRTFDPASALWSNLGPIGPSLLDGHWTYLVVSPSGAPHVIYADRSTNPSPATNPDNDRCTAMKFEGGVWQPLGPVGFSPAAARFQSMAIDTLGTVYAAFEDWGVDKRASIMRYDPLSSSWSFVGPEGITTTTQTGNNLVIAIDRANVPWVASTYNADLIVRRYDTATNTWPLVGGTASGSDKAYYTAESWRQWASLQFDHANRPYVAYENATSLGHRLCVRRFDETGWSAVGALGFTPGEAAYPVMALAPDDTPWVAFRDVTQSGRVSVMKFDDPARSAPISMPGACQPGPFSTPYLACPSNPFIGTTFSANVFGADPGAYGLVFAGPAAMRQTHVGAFACPLMVQADAILPLAYFFTTASGDGPTSGPVPLIPSLVGAQVVTQAVLFLPATGDFVLTNGVLLTVGF